MADFSVSKSGMELCDQVRAAVGEGSLHEQPELQAHVETCEVCRELTAALPALEMSSQAHGHTESPSPELLFKSLEAELERERGLAAFLRSRPTALRRSVVGAVLLVLFAALFLAKPERPLEAADLMHRHVGLIALLAFLLAGGWLALAPIHRASVSVNVRGGLIAAALIGALVIGLAPSAGWWTDPGASWVLNMGLRCLAFGLAIAVPVYGLMRLFDRQPSGPSLLSSALAAGVAGDLALHLRCLNRDAQHFLIGHFGVLLLCLFVASAWSRLAPAPKGAGRRSP